MSNPVTQIAEIQKFLDIQEANAEFDEYISEALLTEASTLMKMIGNRPGGEFLAKWMHINHRLSSSAAYDRVTRKTARIQWQQFKNDPSHFLILTTDKMSVGIKPNTEYYKTNKKAKSYYDPSKDNWLLYDVVAFLNDERVDNFLIPFPQRSDYDNGPEGQAEFKEEVARVTALQKQKLDAGAAATQMTFKRGGLPYAKDARNEQNIFDRIRELGGKINEIYVVSGGTDISASVTGNGSKGETTIAVSDVSAIEVGMFVSGQGVGPRARVVGLDNNVVEVSVPNTDYIRNEKLQFEKLERKKDLASKRKLRYERDPGEVEKGISAWPSEPGIEAGKMARRRPNVDADVEKISARVSSFIPNIMGNVRTVLRRAKVDNEILDTFDDIRDDPNRTKKIFNVALSTAFSTKAISPETKAAAAAGDLKALKSVIDSVRSTIITMGQSNLLGRL